MSQPQNGAGGAGADAAADAELQAYYQSYVETFGDVPPVPRERLAFSAFAAPEHTRLVEEVRARALYGGPLDEKTVQFVCFALLAHLPGPGAYWHALAAKRLGATFAELQQVVEIAYMMSGIGAVNFATPALAKLFPEAAAPQETT